MPSELAAYADAGQVLKNFGPVSYQESDIQYPVVRNTVYYPLDL